MIGCPALRCGGLGSARAGMRPWLTSIVATGLSTYALDVVATLAGASLVGSGISDHLDPSGAWTLLAGSYLVWWAGLRVNLAANWALLETTGTSTNVLSKLGFELARRRRLGAPARRLAASGGYVGSELAKEAPYYLGAFGAALLSDAVTAGEALVFLAGANFGAAAYEYGLGRGVRALLDRLPARDHASFENDWDPKAYLAEFYRVVEADERHTIRFFVEAMRHAERGAPVLLFGVGPTLHHVFLAAEAASVLHLGEYLPANLLEIEHWLARRPGAHDWRPFIRHTLACERGATPSDIEVAERERLVRRRITRLLPVDLRQGDPMLGQVQHAYATVISAYCADSATADRREWGVFMARIAQLARPGGLLLVAALRRSRGYRVGGKMFPSADIDERDLRAALAPHCRPDSLRIECRELPEHAAQGYAGIVLASGRRSFG